MIYDQKCVVHTQVRVFPTISYARATYVLHGGMAIVIDLVQDIEIFLENRRPQSATASEK